MSRVDATQPRYKVVDEPGGGRIIVPVKRSWARILLLAAWVVVFGARLLDILHDEYHGKPLVFQVAMIGAGSFICTCMLGIWLGSLVGREVFAVSPGTLTVRHEILGIGWRSKEFDLAVVGHLRVAPEGFRRWFGSSTMGRWRGSRAIAFDYHAKTYRFGWDLEEGEAKMVVAEIRKRANLPAGGER